MSAPAQGDLFPELTARWVGWRRPARDRWQAACEADSEREAFSRLLNVMNRERRGSWELIVLPAGERP
jgi:hypothetical protein